MNKIRQLPAGRHEVVCTESKVTRTGELARWFIRFEADGESTVNLIYLDTAKARPVAEIVARNLGLAYEGDVIDALVHGHLDPGKAVGWRGFVDVNIRNGRPRTFVLSERDVYGG